ncbi:MAG TPA: ArgE/DapE family deacylase [Thermomicrobiales bacterium]|nr:ArgE/DapE family deacylase [Thermomicrobiales bacterium]
MDRFESVLDSQSDELISFLQQLVACRSDSQSENNPEFETEATRCLDLIAAKLESLGLETERWVEPPRFPALAARLPGNGGGRSLAINGHIDVVPVGDDSAWSHPAWDGEIADGKLWGRGACDMKAGVAAGIFAVQALVESETKLDGDLWLHVVADEEVVGWSTRRLAARLPRVDAVIVAEPTGLQIQAVEGGLVHMRIEIDGRESHAGNRYKSIHAGALGAEGGVNAIEKAMIVAEALQRMERDWAIFRSHPLLPAGFNSIMPGMIAGGPGGGADGKLNLTANPGTSPNYCSLEYNIWYLPNETFEEIREEIETFVGMVAQTDPWLREHPPRFTWKIRNVYFPPVDTPADHPIVTTLGNAVRAIGRPVEIVGFTAASELAWYAEQGIPGVIFGPGSIAQAHSPDEYVELAQLRDAARVMALTAAAWCGCG